MERQGQPGLMPNKKTDMRGWKKRGVPLRTLLPLAAVTALLLLFLFRGELAGAGVRRGLSLCTETLFPSLFPFLVLSELLVVMGAGRWLSALFSRPMGRLFGLSGSASAACLMGALCGFPTAMSSGVALLEQDEIEERELSRLSLFANNPSIGFTVSSVGTAVFGNRGAGAVLFLITLAGGCFIGMVLQIISPQKTEKTVEIPPYMMQKPLCAADITGSVRRGFSGLLQVASFLLFFSAVIACICELPMLRALPPECTVLVAGCLEMTSGITLAAAMLPVERAFLLTAFFTGFSGLSVCLQLASVTGGRGFAIPKYLGVKLLHGLLNVLLAQLYLRAANPRFTAATGVFADGLPTISLDMLWIFPFLLLLLLCVVGVFVAQKKE